MADKDDAGGAAERPASGPVSPSDAERWAEQQRLRSRLDKLTAALDGKDEAAQEKRQAEPRLPGMSPDTGRALSMGMRVVSELIAGVAVGGLIGWSLDKWLGTGPFLMLAFLLLGMTAGVWNVIRSTRSMGGGGSPDGGARGA